MSKFVNTPVCEVCWIAREATWDEQGELEVLIGLRIPVRIVEIDTLETCGFCGQPTFIGIYQRVAKSQAPFYAEPREVEE